MSEEKKVPPSEEATDGKPAKKHKRARIIVSIVVVVVVIAGVGIWNWHNQHSFCGTVCHDSMSTYVETYDQTSGQAGTDKWGNKVSDADAMMAVVHKDAGEGCLSCHVPSIPQQLGEVQETISGDYYYPPKEVDGESLMTNSGHESGQGDQFCLRSGCHENDDGSVMTRDDLTQKTADLAFNPHNWRHGNIACTTCHKSHRASVFYCTQCHAEARDNMPSGWVDYSTDQQIEESSVNVS